jgi:serine/threonine-protein kinase HipA
MQRELSVHVDWGGETQLVGRLWARVRGNRATSSFVYDECWRRKAGTFALSPDLPLTAGQFHTERALFPALTDPAPDGWGRSLMRRHERARAEQEGRQPRALFDIDFLVGVDDRTRLGALRLKHKAGDEFLTTSNRPIPPLIDLPALLAATNRIDRGRETRTDIDLVLEPGSSLGGARPKATVVDRSGHLLMAKFPKHDDEWPVTRWEAVVLELAEHAGVETSQWRLENVARRAVLLARRFDRVGANLRVPYTSGMTALGASDHDGRRDRRSYLELADFIRAHGAQPAKDLEQLWRRIVFNVLVSNTDDHLRNHAFLRDPRGWRLSPAFDMNPCPTDVKPRIHSLAIDETDATGAIDLVLAVAPQFGLSMSEVHSIMPSVGEAVSSWRAVAKKYKLKPREIDRMASAFDHEDLRKARAPGAAAPARPKASKRKGR